MPRANRYRIDRQVWHITQRCHRKQFLLKFARDRRAWVRWLHEARRRFGLCVLDYQVTSNHVHLLVLDRGGDEIAAGLQLIAGRTAQAFNQRKRRRGAFWEDRYHATAVDTGEHLARCVVYVDMNMVRAGVVRHPREWVEAGYHEIQQPRGAYRIIDRAALSGLLGIPIEGLNATTTTIVTRLTATISGSEAPFRRRSAPKAIVSRPIVAPRTARLAPTSSCRCRTTPTPVPIATVPNRLRLPLLYWAERSFIRQFS